jgi:CubicO group peptidase (beta-lactamase class C family)
MISAKTPFAPEDVAYDGSRIDALNKHLQRLIDANELQAACYCLSRDGKVFANAALGKLSFRKDDPREMRPDTVQHIASISKLVCAAAIFKLAEDGMLRLNQTAGSVLKEMNVAPYKDITLAHLLSHTSGLNPDPGCFENSYYKPFWHYIATMKKVSWLEAGLSIGMRSKPGTEWAYCTFGYLILGEVISRVSGVNVHDFIAKEIFSPCGMADTAFAFRAPAGPAETEKRLGLLKRMSILDEETEKRIAGVLEGKEQKPSPFDDIPYTGYGIMSTTLDLVKFGTMLMNQGSISGKRVLGRRTVSRMTERFTGPEVLDFCWGSGGVERPYALGPDRRRTADNLFSQSAYFHEGAGGCSLVIDPEERMVGSWFVPFVGDAWNAAAIYGSGAVIWSGLA